MSAKLAVICPQCKLRLQVSATEQKKVIACPDCEMQFKIGAVTQTVVAEKVVNSDSFDAGTGSNSSQQFSNSGVLNPISPFRSSSDKQGGRGRAGKYRAAKRRAQKRTETDDLLQSLGFFLIIMAAFSAVLPLFDLNIGGFSLPGAKVMWLSLMVGLIGTVMLVVSNRHNPLMALGSGIGLLLVVMVVWIANLDLSAYMNGLRGPSRDGVAQNATDDDSSSRSDNTEQIPRDIPRGQINGGAGEIEDGVLNIPAGVGDPEAGANNGIERSPFQKKKPPTQTAPGNSNSFGGSTNDNLGDSNPVPNREADIIEKAQNDLRDELENSFSNGGINPEHLDRFNDKKSEIDKRFKRLHQAGIVNGKADSETLTSNYSWTSVGGRESGFGDALFDGKPMKGIDVVRSGNFLKRIVPIKTKGRYSTSLYRNSASYVSGLNLNIVDGEIIGIQACFAEMAAGGKSLNTSRINTSTWIGKPPTLGNTTRIGGSRVVYGIVAYSDSARIVGIRLIVKK